MTARSRYLLISVFAIGIAVPTSIGIAQPRVVAATPLTVAMEDCKVEGPARFNSDVSFLAILFGGGRTKEQLVKRGSAEVADEKFTVYLPKAKAYSVVNTKPGELLANTSTLVYVDYNGDGKLTEYEGRHADLPLRLGDQMFEVAEIAKDGSRIELRPSKAPLAGAIVGRRCPAFSFKTPDGQVVSNETVAGKTLILDVWSFT